MSELLSGVDITWQDFSVFGPLSKTEKKKRQKEGLPIEDKVIINNVSGTMKEGSFTAIMGPSGCGKTTMLNFLSNRSYYLKGLKVTGEVFVNGNPRKSTDFNSMTGYVMQDDVIMESMTVEEVLTFTAKLRLRKEVWKDRVTQVIKDLELHNCQKSEVGGILKKGISGGEKKRVSIGIEMLTDPSILFLDEPTTGLDSYNSENLIDRLNGLAKRGMTVICTIHQPNSFIYASFDKVLMLAGGSVMFHGDAREAITHFGGMGYPCPKFSNPAEHLLGLLSPIDDSYESRMEVFRAGIIAVDDPVERKEIKHELEIKESTFFEELSMLGGRILKNLARNKLIFVFKIVANVIFILLTLMAFYMICEGTTATSVSDRAGVVFFILVYIAFMAVNSSGAYADEKAMFIREQASKTYRPHAYYISKLVFEAPIDLLIRSFVIFLVYLGVGLSLESPEQIFIFVGISMLIELCARGWGNFLVISIPNIQAASAAAPFLLIVQLLFAGFFINYDNIPKYLIWLEYISMFKYSWAASMINEFNTWDQQKCLSHDPYSPLCDPNNFYSLNISLGMNILALSILALATHLFAYYCLIRLANKFRL